MRKMNLIAAAGLALLAGAAQAQVTLYGNLDVSVAHSKVKGPDINESMTSVDSNNLVDSYIGFKGNEDLGGGLKALFTLESALNVDTGSAQQPSNFWGRNAYVGLSGALGTVKAGNQESLFKTEGAAFNPFGASAMFSTTDLVTGDVSDAVGDILSTNVGSLGGSWRNTVGYTSANFSGFTVSAQYSAKEGAKSTASTYGGGAYAVAANYAAGPLAASVVIGEVKTTDATDTAVKQGAFLLGASYDFGVAKAFAQYGQNKFELHGISDDAKAKFFQLGAIIPVNEASAVLASYGQTKLEDALKNREFSLAYNYSLSKRTGVYGGVNYNKLDVDTVGTYKSTKFAVGVRHAF